MASQVFVPAEFFVSGKLGFICRMYSKEEAYRVRKKFWTSFGQYMKMHLSSEGLAVNWINYKTGIKDLYFKTDVDNKSAKIVIEMAQKDVGLQSLVFEQFEELQPLFESFFDVAWTWYKQDYDESGRLISKIETRLEGVNIFRETDWPEIITFLKTNLLKLDEFWNEVKDSFEIFK